MAGADRVPAAAAAARILANVGVRLGRLLRRRVSLLRRSSRAESSTRGLTRSLGRLPAAPEAKSVFNKVCFALFPFFLHSNTQIRKERESLTDLDPENPLEAGAEMLMLLFWSELEGRPLLISMPPSPPPPPGNSNGPSSARLIPCRAREGCKSIEQGSIWKERRGEVKP